MNILFVHDVLNKIVPDEVLECFKFTVKNHDHYTRETLAGCLEVPNVKTNSYGISSLSYQAISTWNSLSRILVDSADSQLAIRKHHVLKRLIINHYSSSYHYLAALTIFHTHEHYYVFMYYMYLFILYNLVFTFFWFLFKILLSLYFFYPDATPFD